VHKLAVVCALQVDQLETLPALSLAQPTNPQAWHALDAAYNAHHFGCRAASASSAAMCRRQSLRLMATAHHRFTLFDAL